MGWCYYSPQGRIDRLTECRNEFGGEPGWATIVKDALVDDIYYAAIVAEAIIILPLKTCRRM